jgi:shikimate kinase
VTPPSAARPVDRLHVALVGLSGTGKSTLAPLLASRLRLGVADLDGIVAARQGRSVAEIFSVDGEAAFRAAESAVLSEVLDGPPTVLATGGGVVLADANRRLLIERSRVVWLRADPELLAARLAASAETRPLVGADAVSTLRRLADEREAHYREVADLVVDAGDPSLDPDGLADRVAAELADLQSAPSDDD